MASDVDIAWAAGLFEGEGSCSVLNGRQPVVQLAMTDEDVVARFVAIVGVGKVTARRGRTPRHKPQWHWTIGSRDGAVHVLGLFWPYLGERRQEQAMVVLERCVKTRPRHWQTDFCRAGHDKRITGYIHSKTNKRRCRVCNTERAREYRARRAAV